MDELDVEFEKLLGLALSDEELLAKIEEMFEQNPDSVSRDPDDEDVFRVALRAYSDTVGIVAECARIVPARVNSIHEQAVCFGLCVRLSKYMEVVLSLARERKHREVIYALIRSILETAATFRYLVRMDNRQYFVRFVKEGFGPERELYDGLNEREANGETLDIFDQRLKDSIRRFCEISGLQIEAVRRADRGLNIDGRTLLQGFHEERMYAAFFRSPSHAVHGDWVDLLMHHLDYDDNGHFSPRLETFAPNPSYLIPPAYFVLEAISEYLANYNYNEQTEAVTELIERARVTRYMCLAGHIMDGDIQQSGD